MMRSIAIGILCMSLTCNPGYCEPEQEPEPDKTTQVEEASEKSSTQAKKTKLKTIALISGVFAITVVSIVLAAHYKGNHN